jgi:hypothetical protein
MDEEVRPSRRASAVRLLAAALAGGIGAFGVPAGAQAAPQAPTTVATPIAAAPDVKPE